MKIRIDALDTLSFGVGKPSGWGEDTFGAGIFPPFPSVIRGALRAAWLYKNGSLNIAETSDDLSKEFVITDYAVLFNGIPHFPLPSDHLFDENDALLSCKPVENCNMSSLTTPYQLVAEVSGKLASAEQQYVSLIELQNYLNGNEIKHSVPLADYKTDESRIGIHKEKRIGTVKEGGLYRSPLVRPESINENNEVNKTSLVISASNISDIEGLIRFGGENKVARFSEYNDDISPKGMISEDGMFKIYIATPAIFDNGYLPELPVSATLLTASINGYDNIGGFDMKLNRPKPMRRAVKAGSVYYYKLNENTEENRNSILELNGNNISDYSGEDGFGICYIGKIN